MEPAWPCEGVVAPALRRCSTSSSGFGHGFAATLDHHVHLLVPAGMAEDSVSCAPQRQQVCGRWQAGNQGTSLQRYRSLQRSEFQQTGANVARVVVVELFVSSLSPRVRGKHPVPVQCCDAVVPLWAEVFCGGWRIRLVAVEVGQ